MTPPTQDERKASRQLMQWGATVIVGWCVISGSAYLIWGLKGLAVVTLIAGVEIVARGHRARKEIMNQQQTQQMRDAARASHDILRDAEQRGVNQPPPNKRGHSSVM